jgi:hypothetical protein
MVRCFTSQVDTVCGVCPHPFTVPEYLVMVFKCLGASESPCIMHTTSVAQQVINDQQVLRQTDDLKGVS